MSLSSLTARGGALVLAAAVGAALLSTAAAQAQASQASLVDAWAAAMGPGSPYKVYMQGDITTQATTLVGSICPTFMRLNLRNNGIACLVLKIMERILISNTNTTSADPSATGYGSQQQLDFRSTAGIAAPVALQRVSPLPAEFSGDQLQQLLPLEGATYAWLYAVIRNMVEWWPCSSGFGGSLSGYLSPAVSAPGTFSPVTIVSPGPSPRVTPHPGAPGVYALKQVDLSSWNPRAALPPLSRTVYKTFPFFSMYVAAAAGSPRMLVIAFRGTNTRAEWLADLAYHRVTAAAFPNSTNTVPGLTLPSFQGGTHAGFTDLFNAVWPTVQQALLDHVIAPSSDPSAGVTGVTVTGHSLGAGVATLVAYAAQKVLNAAWTDTARLPNPPTVDLVTFGPPNVGDSAFRDSLHSLGINARRIAFDYDIAGLLPCASPVTAAMQSMPGCPGLVVRTDRTGRYLPARGRAPPREIRVRSWADYQPIYGSVAFNAADMPTQQSAWQATEQFSAKTNFFKATHVCSYDCFTSAYTQGNTDNSCLLESPAAPGFSFCPGFPPPPVTRRRAAEPAGFTAEQASLLPDDAAATGSAAPAAGDA